MIWIKSSGNTNRDFIGFLASRLRSRLIVSIPGVLRHDDAEIELRVGERESLSEEAAKGESRVEVVVVGAKVADCAAQVVDDGKGVEGGGDVAYWLLSHHWMFPCSSVASFRSIILIVLGLEVKDPVVRTVTDCLVLSIAHGIRIHCGETRECELHERAQAPAHRELVRLVEVLRVVDDVDGEAEELRATVPVSPSFLNRAVEANDQAHGEVKSAEEVEGQSGRLDMLVLNWLFLLRFFELVVHRLELFTRTEDDIFVFFLGKNFGSSHGADGEHHAGRE